MHKGMADSACLMQTFSHSPDSHHEVKEGNPIHALGESVSFGRFMSESLAWERWSSFNHNRYLEEVEKYSRPGSVAQKKAYFEAHYKRIAQEKAAALLEQANAASNDVCDPEVENGGVLDSEFVGLNSNVVVDEPEDVKVFNAEVGFSIDANGCNSHYESCSLETAEVEEADPVIKEEILVENSTQIESPNQHGDVENQSKVTEMEICTTKQIEKSPLKVFQESLAANREPSGLTTKVEPVASSSKSSVSSRASKIPSPPARPSTPIYSQEPSALTTKVKPVASSSKSSVSSRASKIPSPPPRPRTPVYSRRENTATPNSKKPARDAVDRKRSTPKSLHMSLNFAPTPSRASEINKMSSPIIQKRGDSRVASGSNKTSKDWSTPLRPPSRASTSTNGIPKPPPVTPQSGSKRSKTPLGNTAPASRKMDVKWQSFSIEHSISSSASRNKASSPVVSSSFSFRSDERAAKRKEYFQKLEEEFNAKEAQKMQLQAKSKEKDETELKKLRQSLSFKAKPMPDFYRETGSPKSQIKKIPLTRPRSPKLGRKPSPGAVQNASSLPPRKSSVKSDDSKLAVGKTSRTPPSSVASQPRKNAHENASPNIQS